MLIERNRVTETRDSVIVRDSVVIREMPDGSRIEQYYRYETLIRSLMHTIREMSERDTYLAQWHESQDSCLMLQSQLLLLRDSLAFITDSIAEHHQLVTKERNRLTQTLTSLLLAAAFLVAVWGLACWVGKK